MDAVGGVNAGGVLSEIARGQMQHRIGQIGIVLAALVLELANVVGEHDAERRHAGEAFLQILAVSLDGSGQCPQVHAVGPDAHGAAPPAGAERQDLVKAVEQAWPLLAPDQPFQLRPVRGELGLGQPLAQVFQRLPLEAGVGVDPFEPFDDLAQQIHEGTS